jgi:hypothetical protein
MMLMTNEIPLTVLDYEIFDATVPDDHYLRRVHDAIDFGPIRIILLSSYHPTLGRPPTPMPNSRGSCGELFASNGLESAFLEEIGRI